jgi:predicted peroxiredoxin
MAEKVFYVATHATDDPTLATVPFVVALGGKSAGIDVEVVLIGEGVYLMKDEIANSIYGVGFPPLSELLSDAVSQGIPIHV